MTSRALRLFLALVLVYAAGLALVGQRVLARDNGGATADESSDLQCLPVHRPTSAEDINAQINRYRRLPDFVGADVGATVMLRDGRFLWVFGDTLRSAEFDGPHFVHNSLLLISPTCASILLPPDKGAFIPDRKDGIGYWPMSMGRQVEPGGDRIGITLMRMRKVGNGTFDFEILGSSVAQVWVPTGGTPELLSVVDLGGDRQDDTRPVWGAAVTVTPDWVYVYGTASPTAKPLFGWDLHVARTTVENMLRPFTWDYWDGSRWTKDDSRLGTLIPADKGVSRVLSVFTRDGAWYAVSKRNDFVGRDLVIWKAPAPQGPFTAGPVVADIPSDKGVIQYMPLAHPDVVPEEGSVLVSWSRNVADLEAIAEDPSLYRPEFARVPLP